MIDKIKESDWKYLKKLKPILLERACAQINKEAQTMLENGVDHDQHELYIKMYKHYDKKDDLIAECFNDYRRSKAKFRILSLVRHGIMSDDELQGFSDDTKRFVSSMMEE
jgi:hypothetical protein